MSHGTGRGGRAKRTGSLHRDSYSLVLAHKRHGGLLKAEGIKLPRQKTDGASIVDPGATEGQTATHQRQPAGARAEACFDAGRGEARRDHGGRRNQPVR